MSVQSLASNIKNAVDTRIRNEARALRGTVKNGTFISGSKSFPAKQAVDCNTRGKVWAVPSTNGKAVIVGA